MLPGLYKTQESHLLLTLSSRETGQQLEVDLLLLAGVDQKLDYIPTDSTSKTSMENSNMMKAQKSKNQKQLLKERRNTSIKLPQFSL